MPTAAPATPSGPASPAVPVTVYYDGTCALCRREIERYRASGAGDRLDYVDLADERSADRASGLDRAAAKLRLHARRTDGKLVTGLDAYSAVWQQIPAWQGAGRLLTSPGFRQIAGAVYWVYLRYRPGFQAWEKVLADGDERRRTLREERRVMVTAGLPPQAPPGDVVPAARQAALAAAETASGDR